jgi:TatA/E family protein of Tat protein translocase
MPTVLLFFESLGTGELLMIAVVALLLFGPRKLPEIGRTLGKSLAEFKRASDDFKRTWEYEVELERRKPALDAAEGTRTAVGESPERSAAAADADASGVNGEEFTGRAASARQEGQTVARTSFGSEAADGAGHGGAREQEETELNAS